MHAGRARFDFSITIGDRTLESSVRLPVAPATVPEILPVLLELDRAVIQMSLADLADQGMSASCRLGCAACCRHMVAVGEAEARYLAELVDSMPPERQALIRGRFQQILDKLEALGMIEDARRFCQIADPERRLRFAQAYLEARMDCPFLENEACTIYQHRPMCCREFMVTSPPENCWRPTVENIQRVPLPVRPSQVLYRFGRSEQFYIPLVTALEWVASNPRDGQPVDHPVELFRRFLAEMFPREG